MDQVGLIPNLWGSSYPGISEAEAELMGSVDPDSNYSEDTIKKINELGVRLIINLDAEAENLDQIRETVKGITFKHYETSNADLSKLKWSDSLKNLFGEVTKTLDKNEGVLIHCQAGFGRTGTMLAAYILTKREKEMDPDKVIKYLRTGEGFYPAIEYRDMIVETIPERNALWKLYNEIHESNIIPNEGPALVG